MSYIKYIEIGKIKVSNSIARKNFKNRNYMIIVYFFQSRLILSHHMVSEICTLLPEDCTIYCINVVSTCI